MTESFLELVNKNSLKSIYLIRGQDQAKPAWYYLKINKLKIPIFLKLIEKNIGKIPLIEHGKVLEYGWGIDPPNYIRERFKKL